jgi:rhodanese-related sulfurtransferase
MKTITPIELQMLINQCDVELIDVRPKQDFKEVHALVGRSVPLSRFEPHSVLAHRKLDRRSPLYIMSRDRALASLAACSLAGAGLAEPVVVEGGIEAWEGQCLPVVRNKSWRRPAINASMMALLASFLSALARHFRLVSNLAPGLHVVSRDNRFGHERAGLATH